MDDVDVGAVAPILVAGRDVAALYFSCEVCCECC